MPFLFTEAFFFVFYRTFGNDSPIGTSMVDAVIQTSFDPNRYKQGIKFGSKTAKVASASRKNLKHLPQRSVERPTASIEKFPG